MIPCQEVICASALHRISSSRLPYHWDLNIYRGCHHRCQYCFAMYTRRYLNNHDFFNEIYVKKNIVEQLRKKLASRTWDYEAINCGGITDSYQPLEAHYQIMPEVLKLMIAYQNPLIICTKSNLILRDYDYFEQLSKVAYTSVAVTITTADEQLQKKLEPGASCPQDRFAILREMRKTNVSLGVHLMPIIPFLTDSLENLEAIFSEIKDCQVDYVIPGILSLKGITKTSFYHFIDQEYPHLSPKIKNLYQDRYAFSLYRKELYEKIHFLLKKYGLSSDYKKAMREKLREYVPRPAQLSFLTEF